MKKSHLLGALCICVIALVSASTNPNDPLSSGLLNTVFILSCGVIGVLLLRKANLSQTMIVRQRGGRRFDLPVEFPLTDSQGLFVVKDRRRLPDRRNAEHGIGDLRVILSKMARKKAA
jgi:hypothetical protein